MVVELICVGTELLLGNIVNTNAAYLSEKCALLGLSMYHQSVVGDNAERLKESLETALNRSDVVILSGGLGPTQDDLTKETAAEVMDIPLKEDPHPERGSRSILRTASTRSSPTTTGSRPWFQREPSFWTMRTVRPRASSWRRTASPSSFCQASGRADPDV